MSQSARRVPCGLSLESIRENCVIDGVHWIWKGATTDGTPRVWAPDLARGGKMISMSVTRAVWQLRTGQPVPPGQRAYRACTVAGCVAPGCTVAGTPTQWGKSMSRNRRFSSTSASIARLKLALRMRALSDEQILEIQASSEKQEVLAAKYGCGVHVISKARNGHYKISSPFAGLMGQAARS